jgi:hypothetical protein
LDIATYVFSDEISLNIQSINYDTPIVKAEFCEDKFLLMKIDKLKQNFVRISSFL